LLVQTRSDAQVEVEMSDDMQTVSIDFDTTPFEVHDYFYVLKNMALGKPNNNSQVSKDGVP